MTFSDFIPYIAAHLGLSGPTLVFLIFCINQFAKVAARRIPDDATGWLGTLRDVAAWIGADPSSVLTSDGTTIKDVSKASLDTPPIPQKVAAAAEPTT